MSVILKKEKIPASDVICQKYSQTTIDCDVIVPDINPDIRRILDVSGFVSIKEKSVRSNKVYIQGCVTIKVLYSPDGEVMSKVKALTAKQDFSHTVDVGNADGDLILLAEVEPENFSYSLINSRKVNLRCCAGISVKLTKVDSFEIPTDAESEYGLCIDTKNLRLCNTAVSSESIINICQQLDMPSGKPTIGEILKTTVFPQSLEFTLVEDKAIAKGQVRICNLYISADDGSIQFVEHTVPFSEILDVSGAEEDMEGEIEYSVSDIYCEARDDSDGEARIFGVDISLHATTKGLIIQEPNIICDAYCLSGKAVISTQDIAIEQLIDNTTAQLTHKCSALRPEPLPEISQICDISAIASVDRISSENNEITLFGHIKSTILYITDDSDYPLASFTDVSDFSHSFHVAGANAETICEAKVFTEHTSYTISGGESIEIRAVLGLNVRSFKNETISQITDISIEDVEKSERKPCIVVYFVQSGDTLWSIAKRYQTSVDALIKCNNLTTDMLDVGQEIRICR